MNNDIRHQWSRHYDTVQWTANTFLLTAAGALHIYVHENTSAAFALVGALLMLLSVFFTKSFRNLRNRVHRSFSPEDWREAKVVLLNDSLFYQGTVNTIVQALFYVAFVIQIHRFNPGHGFLCLLGLLAGLGLILVLELAERKGRRRD